MTTLLPKQIVTSNISFGDVRTLDSGAKVVYTSYNGQRLLIQSPLVSLPYGIGTPYEAADKKDKQIDMTKFDMSFSFKGWNDNPKMKTFYDKMSEIEKAVENAAVKNCDKWFPGTFGDIDDPKTKNILIKKMMTEMIKPYRDKETKKASDKYPPTMKIKLPYSAERNDFSFECFDMDGEKLEFKDIMYSLKNSSVKMIIQMTGVWISAGKFGCTWKLIMGKFQLSESLQLKFVDESDDETTNNKNNEDDDLVEEAINNSMKITDDVQDSEDESPSSKGFTNASTKVAEEEDDDEEEEEADEDDEEEEEAPPPPPPKDTKTSKNSKAKSSKKQ